MCPGGYNLFRLVFVYKEIVGEQPKTYKEAYTYQGPHSTVTSYCKEMAK